MSRLNVTTNNSSISTIHSVEKAMDILRVLSREARGLPLAEIARRLQFSPSTTHHLLATLNRRGFVAQDHLTRTYRLGYGLVGLVQDFLTGVDLHAAGLNPVRKLADLTGETAYLIVLNGSEQVPIIKIVGWQPIQPLEMSCLPVDLHATASGKALLAYLPDERLSALMGTSPLRQYTPNTLTDLLALRVELATIRNRRWALDREERFVGVRSVAASVLGPTGECVAVVSVAFPANRRELFEDLIPTVCNVADEVSRNLGHANPVERQMA